MSDLHDAAQHYASLGWPVFPCQPGGKAPITVHGCHDATCDYRQLDRWWRARPAANIGLATGHRFDALDIDSPDALETITELYGPDAVPTTTTVATAKGWHLYVTPTGHGNRAGLLAGVDYRGRGGYVIAPPSIHPSGATYRFTARDPLADALVCAHGPVRTSTLAAAPAWLMGLLEPPPRAVDETSRLRQVCADGRAVRYGSAALHGEAEAVAAAPEGQRNDTLNRAAFRVGQLVAAGLIEPTRAADILLSAALFAGLGQVEAEGTIASGLKAGRARPR